jgi:hypothetical protein
MFDPDPKSFPVGFSHDVSLVDISSISDAPRTIQYATGLTWLNQQEWMGIKYNSSNLVLLDDRSREAKSIGIVDSRCQVRSFTPLKSSCLARLSVVIHSGHTWHMEQVFLNIKVMS